MDQQRLILRARGVVSSLWKVSKLVLYETNGLTDQQRLISGEVVVVDVAGE